MRTICIKLALIISGILFSTSLFCQSDFYVDNNTDCTYEVQVILYRSNPVTCAPGSCTKTNSTNFISYAPNQQTQIAVGSSFSGGQWGSLRMREPAGSSYIIDGPCVTKSGGPFDCNGKDITINWDGTCDHATIETGN